MFLVLLTFIMVAAWVDWSPLACVAAGFVAGYWFRPSVWYTFAASSALVVLGMLFAFSVPGLVLILGGVTLFGACLGSAVRGRVARASQQGEPPPSSSSLR